ncbi:helix-turn-helix domain-containing protein [Nostoc sp. CHAB 5836]|uniref:helix-turn-helix domain-containing protein n=1 Tax=Nostoc sp. CHAB 5836 TaxID=2780404 RepID=UPI001E2F3447|nr:helix-turn-helix domain-containing protein [Nostoc sp. CHAB 5836]MCC5619626.1 helix-turn-helix domain-containing protein [Nostoc sp. CHAB 5836]
MHTKWTEQELKIIEVKAEIYTIKQIAQVLRLNLSTVTRWVKRGWLKATRRSAKHYQIRRWHLKQFLEHPPQSIKKRITSLDPEAINYLLGRRA